MHLSFPNVDPKIAQNFKSMTMLVSVMNGEKFTQKQAIEEALLLWLERKKSDGYQIKL